ncbi:DUF2971 domain-containing protein [Pseudomonas sp. SK]|uniref:DUF2971 domain-containing protein n=1 Tax=Pseudomonas sp. SK TaxID=2729423 RepID=UPI00146463B4|nr:DUF2971 domain-containing protein [Pseudomonas sp. SK]QJQ18758.1 DUF2971 domain-containing protein [Pseudomonas sp. SK]
MSTYYRFRSADRLLGRAATENSPARSGELDELTVYFASPQELNDPLEGHRETFFQGDLVVWRNLLKHYALVLFSSTIDVYVNGGDGEITYINLRPESYGAEPRGVLEGILDAVKRDEGLNDYFSAIVDASRKVSRYELIVHLMTIHNIVLMHVFNGISTRYQLSDSHRYMLVKDSFYRFAGQRAAEIRAAGGNPDLNGYKEIKSKIKQQALRGNALRDKPLSAGQMRVFVNFSEEFAQQLDYLIYPHWYVVCFMESGSNPAIWGSYGDNHKGICLMYESQLHRGVETLRFQRLPPDFVKAFNYGRPDDQWRLDMECQMPLMKVRYDSEYTTANFFTSLNNEQKEWALSYWYSEGERKSQCGEWLANADGQRYASYRAMYEKSVTTKTAHWGNETECRIIMAGYPFEREERTVGYNFFDLKGLIFGINTSDEVKVRAIRKIADHCKVYKRSDFKFYQARYDDNYQKIEHDHLSYITFEADGSLNFDPNIADRPLKL